MIDPGYFKTGCATCKGHIEYPKKIHGRTILCPHCGLTTDLRFEVKHIRTSDVEDPPPGIDYASVFPHLGFRPIKAIPNFKEYVITLYFLVNGVEWKMRTICGFHANHIYKATGMPQQYNPHHHKDYNNLVLILADRLFNRLVRGKCNQIVLGLKNPNLIRTPRLERPQLRYNIGNVDFYRFGQGTIEGDSAWARKFSKQNTITLKVGNSEIDGYFNPRPDEGYEPYFTLSKRDWF